MTWGDPHITRPEFLGLEELERLVGADLMEQIERLLENKLDGAVLLDAIHNLLTGRTTKKEMADWLYEHGLLAAYVPHTAMLEG